MAEKTSGVLRVIGVGCGEPKKSMGWFHLKQMMEDPAVTLEAVVEPWFLGPGKDAPGAEAFRAFSQELQAAYPGLLLCASPEELPLLRNAAGDPPVLAVIAGRTRDAPKLFRNMCERGATHIYLEKPGAETAVELEELQALAEEKGITAMIGYNKNVSEYMQGAVAELERLAAEKTPTGVTLEHNNAFNGDEDLRSFALGPGAEGLVHNMCCHELALAASFFGVSRDRLRSVVLEPEYSEAIQVAASKEDWKRVGFRLLLDGAEGPDAPLQRRLSEIRFVANRCGGNFSQVHVGNQQFRLPRKEQEIQIQESLAKDPDVRPYFIQQAADYQRLRGGFVRHILDGGEGVPPGVVDLSAGIETLRLADLLSKVLWECHKGEEPWTWHAAA